MARSGLGKGLGALIGTPSIAARTDVAESGERVHQIDLATIVPSALQPRKDFGREALQELIDSIRQHGVIQPLIVRQVGARFELIAGERRWRAAQEIGLATAPAIVRTANDLEVLELSLETGQLDVISGWLKSNRCTIAGIAVCVDKAVPLA